MNTKLLNILSDIYIYIDSRTDYW